MKKSIIVIIGTLFLVSCAPKTAINGTTTPTPPVITTKAEITETNSVTGDIGAMNSSNTINSSNTEDLGELPKNTMTIGEENKEDNTEVNNTKGEGGEKEEDTKDTEGEDKGKEEDNTKPEDTDKNDGEQSGDDVDINKVGLDTSVVEIGNTTILLPAPSSKFEKAGLEIDWKSEKYSNSDKKSYVNAKYNGKEVLLGLKKDGVVNEVVLTSASKIKMPGGFTVGSPIKDFRKKFGYWGGDIYKIKGSTYIVSGKNLIEKIVIKTDK